MKKIIIPIIVCLLLVITITLANPRVEYLANPRVEYQRVETINNNNFLNVSENLNVNYVGYQREEEYVMFFFSITDYERNQEGINYRVLRSMDTTLDNDVLSYCIRNRNCNDFITPNNKVDFRNRSIETLQYQVTKEKNIVRNRISEIKDLIRRDDNIDNYLEDLEIEI